MQKTLTALALIMPMSLLAQQPGQTQQSERIQGPEVTGQPSYNFLEGGLNFVDPPTEFSDDDSSNGDVGVQLRGSMAQQNTFLRGEVSTNRFDGYSFDLVGLGIGYIIPTEQPMDVYAAADFLYEFGESNSGGYRLEGGTKAVLGQGWDTTAGLRFEQIDSETYLQAFASSWVPMADQLSVGGEVGIGDFNEFLLGARYQF